MPAALREGACAGSLGTICYVLRSFGYAVVNIIVLAIVAILVVPLDVRVCIVTGTEFREPSI